MEKRKPKLVLAFIESGMGHITSMQAVKEGLIRKYSDVFDIADVHPMDDNGPAKKYELFMIKQVLNTNTHKGFGPFIFFLLEILGRQWFFKLLHRTLIKASTDSAVDCFVKEAPDVIVSTNHYTTFCALEYKRKHNPNVLVVTYNPDNNTHVWWDGWSGIFIVNNEFAYDEALSRGFKKENMRKSSYTVRQKLVDSSLSKEEYRLKYNLPLDKFTVIIADGAYARAKSKDFAMELVKTDKPLTILFIAGKNDEMFANMTAERELLKKSNRTNITLEVYPFMPDIHELYKAADLFITKAGPNSIFDSLYMGTPVVVNYCSQPMEKKSYKWWVGRLHCGTACFNEHKIRPLVESYIENPSLLNEYKENLTKYAGQSSGSDEIADIVYTEYQKQKGCANGKAE
ncbi:MAG: glycosyltransferase [Clostridia bacterium]